MRMDWIGKDNRVEFTAMYYLLLKLCKRTENEYTLNHSFHSINTTYAEADYFDVKWIIDRANFRHAKQFGYIFFPYEIFTWFEDGYFVPEQFICDWKANYKLDKCGKIKCDKNGRFIIANVNEEYDYTWYISQATKECLNNIILRWKIYGRWLVKLNKLYSIHIYWPLYKLKKKIQEKKDKSHENK